jgi:predicted transcriptional regulator
MATTTIRVSTKTQQTLRQLAAQAGLPMQAVVDRAIELYRRTQILNAANAAYAALRDQPAVLQEMMDERAAWDATLADGLPED